MHNELTHRFRRQTGRRSISRVPLTWRDRWVLGGLTVSLLVATWPLGGNPWWAQILLGVCSLTTLALCFVPMGRMGDGGEDPRRCRRQALVRLIRFPIFWLGLGLVLYILVQNLNPAYAFATRNGGWTLIPLDPVTWLPSGMVLPNHIASGWRSLLLLGSVWLLLCAFWIGVRRPRAIRIFLWIFLGNLFLWAVITLLQVLTNAPNLLWFYETPVVLEMVRNPVTGEIMRRTAFFGMMINPNHAAALLNLGLVACGTAFFHYHERARRTYARSGPHLVLLVMGVVVLCAIALALSRAALLLAVMVLLWFLLVHAYTMLRHWREMGNPLPAILLVVGLFAIVGGILAQLDWGRFHYRVAQTQRLLENPASEIRYYINQGTMLMFQERRLYGWGAGSYRYRIPAYEREIPELRVRAYYPYWDEAEGRMCYRPYRVSITHAHNDFLHYAAELGVVGCAFLLGGLLWGFGCVVRYRRQLTVPWVFLGVGLVVVALHGFVDFIFFIPAILTCWSLLALAGVQYLHATRRSRAERPLASR